MKCNFYDVLKHLIDVIRFTYCYADSIMKTEYNQNRDVYLCG